MRHRWRAFPEVLSQNRNRRGNPCRNRFFQALAESSRIAKGFTTTIYDTDYDYS
jgi:hypothetical protein